MRLTKSDDESMEEKVEGQVWISSSYLLLFLYFLYIYFFTFKNFNFSFTNKIEEEIIVLVAQGKELENNTKSRLLGLDSMKILLRSQETSLYNIICHVEHMVHMPNSSCPPSTSISHV